MKAWPLVSACWAIAGVASADPPEGDQFANPITGDGPSWSWRGRIIEATAERGEPSHFSPNSPARNSIWFRWTAVDSTPVVISSETLGDFYGVTDIFPRWPPAGVAVYELGTRIDKLPKIAGPIRTHTEGTATEFSSAAGRTYLMAFDGFPGETNAPKEFEVRLSPLISAPPANDNLMAATGIEGLNSPVHFQLGWATRQAEEPDFGDWRRPSMMESPPFHWDWGLWLEMRGGNSEWYRWEAPETGTFVVDTTMPASFPMVSVFQLPAGAGLELPWSQLERVQMNPNGSARTIGEFDQLQVDARTRIGAGFRAQAGDVFAIQVDQLGHAVDTQPEGFFGLEWLTPRAQSFGHLAIVPGARNDDLVGATELEENVASQPVQTTGPTFESGEPPSPVPDAQGSLWWKWTAPSNTTVAVYGAADVFAGDRYGELSAVEYLPKLPAYGALPRFRAAAGTRYLFRAVPDQNYWSVVNVYTEASNNRFDHAEEILVDSGIAAHPKGIGSVDPGEPVPPENMSTGVVWYRWVPQRSGRYDTDPVQIQVFQGHQLESLDPVARSRGTWGCFEITAGVTYYWAVRTMDTGYPATITFGPRAAHDDFANRLAVTSFRTVTNPAILATAEDGEPAHAHSPAHASVWFEWRPMSEGRMAVLANGPGGPRVAIYRGQTLNELVEVTSAQAIESDGNEATAVFEAQPNDVLQVAVEPGRIDQKNYEYPGATVRFVGPPSNDLPQNAQTLSSVPRAGTTMAATSDAADQFEGGRDGLSTVWYRIEPVGGNLDNFVVRLTSRAHSDQTVPASLKLLRGTDPANLVLLAESVPLASDVPVVASFTTPMADPLWVQVATEPGTPAAFDISIQRVPDATGLIPLIQLVASGDEIRLVGTDGQFVRFEQTSDLQQWVAIGDAVISGNRTVINLSSSNRPNASFVRAKAIP